MRFYVLTDIYDGHENRPVVFTNKEDAQAEMNARAEDLTTCSHCRFAKMIKHTPTDVTIEYKDGKYTFMTIYCYNIKK